MKNKAGAKAPYKVPRLALCELPERQIESEQEHGVEQIKENMLALIARRGRVKLVDHTLAVFGETYGEVPEKFARRAARELSKAGKIQLNAQPKQRSKLCRRREPAAVCSSTCQNRR